MNIAEQDSGGHNLADFVEKVDILGEADSGVLSHFKSFVEVGRHNRGLNMGKPTKMLPRFVPLACHHRVPCEQEILIGIKLCKFRFGPTQLTRLVVDG